MGDCCLHLLLKVISGENLFLQWQTRKNCCFKHVISENLNELPLQSACWTVNALLFSSKTSLATLQWTSFVTKDNKCWFMHTWVLWWLAASELSVLNHLREMWRLQFDVYANLNWLFPSTPLSWKLWCYICLTYQLIHWFYLHWHKCLCNWKRSTLCAQKSWWWFIQRRWWWRDKDSQAVVSGISTIISAAWHFVNMRFGYHCPVDGSTGINFNTSQLSGMTSGL